ncbi:hypothetical protein ACFXJ8_40700 [Nonomuraea sp. NPDC059194]|uniref:hypothetical protein n=1 Tax=Nonomuraea sp. NPDC059194 TaxID=3346764 RepID=UPI0036BEC77D
MTDRRTAFVTGLRDLAAYFEANPDVPLPRHSITALYFPPKADDKAMRADIDHVAALLGTEIDPKDLQFGHYKTGLSFGPVRYEALAILADARARHEAANSYRDNIALT